MTFFCLLPGSIFACQTGHSYLESINPFDEALLTVTPNELLEMKNADGDNVAHVAAEHNHLNIVQRLNEIDPEIFKLRNDQGFTTAGVACKNGIQSSNGNVVPRPRLECSTQFLEEDTPPGNDHPFFNYAAHSNSKVRKVCTPSKPDTLFPNITFIFTYCGVIVLLQYHYSSKP